MYLSSEEESSSCPEKHGECTSEHRKKRKIRNEDISQESRCEININEKADMKIGQRAGHSAKMQDDRCAKKTSEWTLRASTRQKGMAMERWYWEKVCSLLDANCTGEKRLVKDVEPACLQWHETVKMCLHSWRIALVWQDLKSYLKLLTKARTQN